MKKLMIYGAAGYTGGMAAEHAASAGLDLVLAGREKDRRALEALAELPVTLPDLLTIHQATGVAHIRSVRLRLRRDHSRHSDHRYDAQRCSGLTIAHARQHCASRRKDWRTHDLGDDASKHMH
jgi:hypothetical protein